MPLKSFNQKQLIKLIQTFATKKTGAKYIHSGTG